MTARRMPLLEEARSRSIMRMSQVTGRVALLVLVLLANGCGDKTRYSYDINLEPQVELVDRIDGVDVPEVIRPALIAQAKDADILAALKADPFLARYLVFRKDVSFLMRPIGGSAIIVYVVPFPTIKSEVKLPDDKLDLLRAEIKKHEEKVLKEYLMGLPDGPASTNKENP